jgi:hypothetical protein
MKNYCTDFYTEKQFTKRWPTNNEENHENFDQQGFELGTSQSDSCDIAALTFSIRDSCGPHSI